MTQKLKVVRKTVQCKGGVSKEKNVVVNDKGQGFYSDMDMFAVFDLMSGDQILMGMGAEEGQADFYEKLGALYRARLDKMINDLSNQGIEYNLIQHGASFDWVKSKSLEDETIAVFIPFGAMLRIDTARQVTEFMLELNRQAKKYVH